MTWTIDKQFDFCYGHRVWSQKLNDRLCSKDDNKCKCRFLHGHQAHVKVFLETEELKDGMVTDFKHLGFLKDFFDEYIDHKFILDLNDPWFASIINAKPVFGRTKDELNISFRELDCLSATHSLNTKSGRELKAKTVYLGTQLMGYTIDVDGLAGPEQEFFEGFFLVNFLPTSEHLSQWVAEGVKSKFGLQYDTETCCVYQVEWFETPKSRSTYTYTYLA